MSDNQLDINKVLQKMQNRLAETMTNNVILEARIEQLEEQLQEASSSDVVADE